MTDFLCPLKVTASFVLAGSEVEKFHKRIEPSLYDTAKVRGVLDVDVAGVGAGRIPVTEAVCDGECHMES